MQNFNVSDTAKRFILKTVQGCNINKPTVVSLQNVLVDKYYLLAEDRYRSKSS